MPKQRVHLITTTPLDIDTEKINKDKLTTFMSVVEILGLKTAMTLYNGISKAKDEDEKYELKN